MSLSAHDMHATWCLVANGESSFAQAVVATFTLGLEHGLSRSVCIEKILTFAGERWREVRAHLPPANYSPEDPRFGGQTDDYGTVVDPITQQEIPLATAIVFTESSSPSEDDSVRWCFDAETLCEYIERAQPVNPMTRQPLPQTVLRSLEEYKLKSRTVQITAYLPTSESLSFPFTKGFSRAELVVEVFRRFSAFSGGSSLELMQSFVVDFASFAEPVEEDTTLVLTPVDRSAPAATVVADYYHTLSNVLCGYYSLNAFQDMAGRAYRQALMEMTFLESATYLSGNGFQGFYKVMFPSARGDSFFTMKAQDFFLPLKKVRKAVKWTPTVVYRAFLDKPFAPEDLESLTRQQKYLLKNYEARTLGYLLQDAIEKKNLVIAQKIGERFRSSKLHCDPCWASELTRVFTPEEVYTIAKDIIYAYHFTNEGDPFRNTIYYFLLINLEESMAQQAVTLIETGNCSETDPTKLTELVIAIDQAKYYHLLKSRLDMQLIYRSVAEEECSLRSALTEDELLECLFREGGDSSGLTFTGFDRHLRKLLLAGTDKIDHWAFPNLIGDVTKSTLSAEQIYEYLSLATQNGRENIFCALLAGIAQVIYYCTEEEVDDKLYFSVLERVIDEPSIPVEWKRQAYQACLKTDFCCEEELVQRLYTLIGIEEAVRLYTQSLKILPVVSEADVVLLSRQNPTLLLEIFQRGLVALKTTVPQ